MIIKLFFFSGGLALVCKFLFYRIASFSHETLLSGKTSLFNLMSNSKQRLGNSVSSTTKKFISKTCCQVTYIDTIGFRDTEDENEHRLKVILFLREIRNGFDISMFILVERLYNQFFIKFFIAFEWTCSLRMKRTYFQKSTVKDFS